jgi:hypothetical protein
MSCAPRDHRLAILVAVALAACTTGTQPSPAPDIIAPSHTCAAGTAPLTVAITMEVDRRSATDYLATAPLGPCTVVPLRIPVAEARDALDSGVAMLITSDAAAIAYADTRADLQSTPLPWNRTYALILADSARAPLPDSASALATLKEELARDVVPGDARAAEAGPCGASTPSRRGRLTMIRYLASDHTARSIAARLAAVGGDSIRIDAYEHEALGTADAAIVTAFGAPGSHMCDLAVWIIPLVETRARAISPVASGGRP